MEAKTVLVTGIGGNVGQGIIRNIRKTGFPVKIIGCNINAFSAGNHLCDRFYEVPYANDISYIDTISSIVEKEGVDLVIPSTDYEVYYLSKYKDILACTTAVSDVNTANIYLDKYLSFLHHKQHDIPFADSSLPANYDKRFDQFLVKPREGRGSRGIHINPPDVSSFDDTYLVQRLYKGPEITTAFYVSTDKQLHGFITLERKLENGATAECRVNKEYDAEVRMILEKMIIHAGIIGSANLQSIVTENGEVIPFEINCRISGTNSIRSNFGFEDVRYTLEEFLYGMPPSKPNIMNGIAVRIMMDVIYPEALNTNNLTDKKAHHYLF